jgi:hypothetical protein
MISTCSTILETSNKIKTHILSFNYSWTRYLDMVFGFKDSHTTHTMLLSGNNPSESKITSCWRTTKEWLSWKNNNLQQRLTPPYLDSLDWNVRPRRKQNEFIVKKQVAGTNGIHTFIDINSCIFFLCDWSVDYIH